MKIENQEANELLLAYRRRERSQEFMDAVSGVKGYRLDDHSRQGCIRGRFAKELVRDQFLLELDDVISIFWQGVFEHIDKAKMWNDRVEIKRPGRESEFRETNNNPIHYLRYHGELAVRNHITKQYHKNLHQSCMSCGHTCAIRNDKACKKCGKVMQTVYKFAEINNDSDDLQYYSPDAAEILNMAGYIDELFLKFARETLRSGRAFQIFNILTQPEASRKMCGACKLCPATTFDIDSCTNYNQNIGNHLGVNKTMIANKIRSIRKRFMQFLSLEATVDAKRLLEMVPKKYKALLPIVDQL